jgi:hypothetical protein
MNHSAIARGTWKLVRTVPKSGGIRRLRSDHARLVQSSDLSDAGRMSASGRRRVWRDQPPATLPRAPQRQPHTIRRPGGCPRSAFESAVVGKVKGYRPQLQTCNISLALACPRINRRGLPRVYGCGRFGLRDRLCSPSGSPHFTVEFDERKRSWKLCDCTICVSGTLAGKFIRRTTKGTNWDEARAVSDAWERGDVAQIAAVPPGPPSTAERITITDGLSAYLAGRAAREPRPATMSKYRTLTRQLREWADDKGYVYLDQFTATDMDAFYASWKGGKSSRGKKLERARVFGTPRTSPHLRTKN